jgi:glycosyltransferase involved in cell wall biosynthesis
MSAAPVHLRILVLCYEYPPVGGGGGGVARNVAEKLAVRGHEVRVVTAGMQHLARSEQMNDVAVYRTITCRRRADRCTVLEMGLFLVAAFFPAMHQLRTWRPDVIHAHFAVPTGALAFVTSLLTGVPYVLTAHLGDVPGGFPQQTAQLFRLLKPLTVPIWRRAAAVSAVSGYVRDLAVQAYGRPVEKILNGVNVSSLPVPPAKTHSVPRFVFAGRFVSQKNLEILVDALAQIRDKSWQAILIGDGPLMSEIRERIRAHELLDRITLPGWQSAAAVDQAMMAGDVFVLPSTAEGLPLAAVQALQHRLAIVGSDIGGLHDIIENGINGFIVPVGDIQALAAKLRLLLDDPSLLRRFQTASGARAELFNLDAITTQYEKLLRAAVSDSRNESFHHVS